MKITIDEKSGFCFGVVRAISIAEEALSAGQSVASLGDIVHNRIEVQRLERLGLRTISHDAIDGLCDTKLLIRAHGEPPTTYRRAEGAAVEVIDATCPVVAALQRRVKEAYEAMQRVGGTLCILGKRGHAEVVGLSGQVDDRAVVIERIEDIEGLDFSHPIYLLSQTTQSLALFREVSEAIRQRLADESMLTADDTICRRVSSREQHLREFASTSDVIIFVCGRKSSNGRVLAEVCSAANSRTYIVEEASDLQREWFEGAASVGVCGATSTPEWLMREVADRIEEITENE